MDYIYILGNKILQEDLNKNILSKIFISYRNNFQKINNSSHTNDIGWGCTIRSGQMLIANCLFIHHFGKDFNLINSDKLPEQYIDIISLFIDNYIAKFSLHNIVSGPIKTCIEPGIWYGPGTISYILVNLVNYHKYYKDFSTILCEERVLFYHEVIETLQNKNGILILLPMRLGLNSISELYCEQLISLLKINQFIGMVGGKGSSSFYFLGIDEDDNLIYLDPHKIQEYNLEENITSTYHTSNYGKMNIKSLNTTLSIGFYCKNLDDFGELTSSIKSITSLTKPLIIIDQEIDYKIKKNSQYDYSSNNNKTDDDEWELL